MQRPQLFSTFDCRYLLRDKFILGKEEEQKEIKNIKLVGTN